MFSIIYKAKRIIKILISIFLSTKSHRNYDGSSEFYIILDFNKVGMDFNAFRVLCIGVMEAKKMGKQSHLLVVQGKYFNLSNDKADDYEKVKNRFHNIIIRGLLLFENIKNFSVHNSADEVDDLLNVKKPYCFPKYWNTKVYDYDFRFDKMRKLFEEKENFSIINSPQYSKRFIAKWLKDKKLIQPLVVITLRNLLFEKDRNSNKSDWIKFAHFLNNHGYDVVFVNDSEDFETFSDEKVDKFYTCPFASTDISMRLALMEIADVNMLRGNGVQELTFWSNSRAIIFLPIDETKYAFSTHWFKLNGINVGEKFPWQNDCSNIVWDNDNYDNMVEAFTKYKNSKTSKQSS